jgi:membrane-bound ClpP family serine protease
MSTQSRCRDLEAVLSAYVDHEATPEDMALIEAHVQTCRECSARLRRYQTLTPRLEADVRALLFKAETNRPRFRRPPEFATFGAPPVRMLGRVASVAFALAITAVVGLVLLRSARPGPGVTTGASPTSPAPVATPNSAPVLVASIDGLVDPAVVAYVHRAVLAAEASHAAALVLILDGSGGLDGSLQEVAQDLSTSSVPTLAYLAQGRNELADARLARLLGARPGTSLNAFLRTVDGQQVQTRAGPVTLLTAGARIETFEMEPLEALAHRLLDPTTAYLLFVLGLYAAFVELAHPGSLLPGATGLVCLTLAVAAFTVLPTNWLGVAVLVAAVGCMAVELKAASHGVLVVAGVACLIFGSVLLYSAPGSLSPKQVDVTVPPAVLIAAIGAGLAVGLLLARIARRVHDLPPVLDLERLIGTRGVSRGGLDPEGVVQVGGQLWSARLRAGRIDPGMPVRVVARHGLVLEVESAALGAATRKGTLS